MRARFPDGFLWGVATSAYQIEGAVDEDGRAPSIWDTFSAGPGNVDRGDTGEVATDHYHRFEADVDLMVELGVRAYRFSVAWPRVLPQGTGPINQRGLDFYRRIVDLLRAKDITPAITLYHWDLPQALEDRGGWTNRDVAGWFADYARVLFSALGDRDPLWITLNEPWVAAWLGYGIGIHAPGLRDAEKALMATHHQLLAHGRAVEVMRAAAAAPARIGITLNLQPTVPASPDPEDAAAARRADGYYNRLYLDPVFRGTYPADLKDDFSAVTDFAFIRDEDLSAISQSLDFLGVNYYTRFRISDAQKTPPSDRSDIAEPVRATVVPFGQDKTDMGWTVDPEGLRDVLVRMRDEYTPLPLYVTENGAAYNDEVTTDGRVDDQKRIAYLDAHIHAAHRAIEDGVDLRGYFVWSLLDNFEWSYGYAARFGIVFVDYEKLVRIPKASARWYAGVVRRNGLDG